MPNIFNQSTISKLQHIESQIGGPHDSNTQTVMKDSSVLFADADITHKDIILNKGGTSTASADGGGVLIQVSAVPAYKSMTWDDGNSHMEFNTPLNVEGALKINNVEIVDSSRNATYVDLKCDSLTEKTSGNDIQCNNHVIGSNSISLGNATEGEFLSVYSVNGIHDSLQSTGANISLTGANLIPSASETIGTSGSKFDSYMNDLYVINLNQGQVGGIILKNNMTNNTDQWNSLGESGKRFLDVHTNSLNCFNLKCYAGSIKTFTGINPDINDSYDIGTSSFIFNSCHFTTTNTNTITSISGNLSLSSVTTVIDFDKHILPTVDNTDDIGSSSKQLRKLYSIDVECDNITSSNTQIVFIKNFEPTSDNTLDIGGASKKIKIGYFDTVSTNKLTGSTNVELLTSMIPDASISYDIGSSSKLLDKVYAQTLLGNNLDASSDITIHQDLIPDTDNTINFGNTSKFYNNVYLNKVFVPGTVADSNPEIPLQQDYYVSLENFYNETNVDASGLEGSIKHIRFTDELTGRFKISFMVHYHSNWTGGVKFQLHAKTNNSHGKFEIWSRVFSESDISGDDKSATLVTTIDTYSASVVFNVPFSGTITNSQFDTGETHNVVLEFLKITNNPSSIGDWILLSNSILISVIP